MCFSYFEVQFLMISFSEVKLSHSVQKFFFFGKGSCETYLRNVILVVHFSLLLKFQLQEHSWHGFEGFSQTHYFRRWVVKPLIGHVLTLKLGSFCLVVAFLLCFNYVSDTPCILYNLHLDRGRNLLSFLGIIKITYC